jgi:anti-anti-sigma factor
MFGVAVTAIDVWKDSSVAIVEPLANLYAFDVRNLHDALVEAERMTDVSAVIVTLGAALLVDADSLDEIMTENQAYSARGGRFVLTCVSAPTRRHLELSGVANRIQIYDSLEEALRELSPRD